MNGPWHERHPMPKRATLAQRVAWHRAHQAHCACRPIPERLLPLLRGGDRRSLARSARAATLVERSPARVADLAKLARDDDGLVAMRAIDLLEKLAHGHPEWVQPHKRLFIGPLADSDAWEIRLQIVRALPLLRWTARERERVIAILVRDVDHPRTFVRAWALDSLAKLAGEDARLRSLVAHGLSAFERSGSSALRARARAIRARTS
jgi:hypothetical protein